ncbi:MAG TPA: 3-phosphoshikimate 1-carboxyvinyltransferase, partial [bacterium]|nr:3-phosphoshikimate 1-carboxyvinyltransferase [bacterium]
MSRPLLCAKLICMQAIVFPTRHLQGEFVVPGSKSHTIRAVVIASLARGTSTIIKPLQSADTRAAVNACRSLGAVIRCEPEKWEITGFGSEPKPPGEKLDLMNSGTSLNLVAAVAALGSFSTVLDGDDSLRSRPVQPLLDALNQLGAKAVSLNNGRPPIRISGVLRGGKACVDGINSQFVSSVLIASPLAAGDTELTVANLHEAPYVEMTLGWLDEQNIDYQRNDDLTWFHIKGRQHYHAFSKRIPGDWSSATFPLVAAAICDSDVLIQGLELNDTQGDRAVLDYLRLMGVPIEIESSGIRIRGGGKLRGVCLDLNQTP